MATSCRMPYAYVSSWFRSNSKRIERSISANTLWPSVIRALTFASAALLLVVVVAAAVEVEVEERREEDEAAMLC